jgi:hypothetical protein
MNLRNIDRTDLEMLHIIQEAIGPEGYASSEDIAGVIGLGASRARSAGGRVSSRLSWMARYGQVERIDPQMVGRKRTEALWVITAAGRRIMSGKLRKNVQDAIDTEDPGAQVLMMRRLMQRGYVSGDDTTATTLRREYLHHAAQRNGH